MVKLLLGVGNIKSVQVDNEKRRLRKGPKSHEKVVGRHIEIYRKQERELR